MTTLATSRAFVPGTTGWTAADLDDPEIEALWVDGRYEIVEGVLTTMPPAQFEGSAPLFRLVKRIDKHFDSAEILGDWGNELDIVVGDDRVGRADVAFLTREQIARQAAARKPGQGKRKGILYGRVVVPPLLIIESTSPGHERHDRITKRRWYAEFGIENFWILDAFAKTLTCLRLSDGTYEDAGYGKAKQVVKPRAFEGLQIPLGEIWL
jgi:Uma2 family endonuclease